MKNNIIKNENFVHIMADGQSTTPGCTTGSIAPNSTNLLRGTNVLLQLLRQQPIQNAMSQAEVGYRT